jgi:hypothetical protein
LIRLRPNTYKDDIETVSICSIEFLASNLIWAIVLGLAPKTELRALLTAHPGQERDAAEHLINACCEIGLFQLETCYPPFRGARIGSLRKKTPLPSNRNCSFAENWVIPAAGYPKRRKGMTPWTMAQSLEIVWDNFALMAYKCYLSLSLRLTA